MDLRPAWTRNYQRAWLRPDLIAGLVIWSVVTPQAVAYAQIAGLPPEAGLMAAPVAMLGYGLVGTSHQLAERRVVQLLVFRYRSEIFAVDQH